MSRYGKGATLSTVGIGLSLKKLQDRCRDDVSLYSDEEVIRQLRDLVIGLTGGPMCDIDGHVIDRITKSVVDGWARESEQ